MIGCRAISGFALLCALLFSAFAAQSASALTTSKNTTAFTCVSSGGSTNKDFKDSHCDEKVTAGTGSFEHLAIANNTKTEVDTTNLTNAVLKGEVVGGGKVTITCTVVKNNVKNSTLTNTEPSAGEHTVAGTGETEFTNCTVTELKNCTVKTPIFAKANVHAVEGLAGPNKEANAMGGEFIGSGLNETFTELTFEGATCAIKGTAFPVKGKVIVTNGPTAKSKQDNKHSGSTAVYTPENAMQELTLSGKPATFSVITTASMASSGNPISLTTTT